jgi:hypothetical protein
MRSNGVPWRFHFIIRLAQNWGAKKNHVSAVSRAQIHAAKPLNVLSLFGTGLSMMQRPIWDVTGKAIKACYPRLGCGATEGCRAKALSGAQGKPTQQKGKKQIPRSHPITRRSAL